MPIHKRGAAWEVTICHGGQKYRRSSRQWDRATARQVEQRLLADLRAIDAGQSPARTFYEAIERWLAEELPGLHRPNKYRTLLAQLAPFLENRTLAEGPEAAGEMRRVYQADGLAPATINRRLAMVRRLLSLAYRRWGWLDQPLHQRITMLSERGERHVYLTADDVEALAAACTHAGDAILLAAYTGIRRGQLLRLTAANLVGDCLHLGADGKTGKPQLIPLHPRVQGIRLPLSVTDSALRKDWEEARRQTGLTHIRFHDLRHTCASWLLQSGADLMHVRELLGHSTVAVTQRYAHLATSHLRDAVYKMGAQNGHKKSRSKTAA